jgi:hypothetical protein
VRRAYRRGQPCQAPALRGKARCRLHGGHSTGPKTLDGLGRLRTAKTKHGRFSREGVAVERWRRRYVANAYRSVDALEGGTIRGVNAHSYLTSLLLKEDARGEPPPVALVEERRREARAAVARRDVERLRAKGLL